MVDRRGIGRRRYLNRLVTAKANDGGAMAVEAEGDPYRTTLDRISQFSKKNKQTTRMNAHKTEWLQEWHRLEAQQRKLDQDLEESMKNLSSLGIEPAVVSSSSSSGDEQHEEEQQNLSWAVIAHEARGLESDRQELGAEIKQRWKELRGALSSLRDRRDAGNSGGDTDGLGRSKEPTLAARTITPTKHRRKPSEEDEQVAQKRVVIVDESAGIGADTRHRELAQFGARLAHALLEARRWNENRCSVLDLEESGDELGDCSTRLGGGLGAEVHRIKRRVLKMMARDESELAELGYGARPEADAEMRSILAILGELDSAPSSCSSSISSPRSSSSSYSLGSRPGAGDGVAPLSARKTTTKKEWDENDDPIATLSSTEQPRLQKDKAQSRKQETAVEVPYVQQNGQNEDDHADGGDADDDETPYEVMLARAEVAARLRGMVDKRDSARRTAEADWLEAASKAVALAAPTLANIDDDTNKDTPSPPSKNGDPQSPHPPVRARTGGGGGAAAATTRSMTTTTTTTTTTNTVCREAKRRRPDELVPVDCSKTTDGDNKSVQELYYQQLAREPCGGWPRKDHEAFEGAWKQLAQQRKVLAGETGNVSVGSGSIVGSIRERALDRLRLQFCPKGYSASDVASHADWLEAHQAFAVRRREITAAWKRERGELLAWARQRFAEAREEVTKAAERQRDAEEIAARAQALRLRLEELKPAREARNAAEAAATREEALKAMAEAEAAAAEAERRAKKRRAAVAVYHQERSRAAETLRREEVEAAAAAEAARKVRREANGARVTFRIGKRQEAAAAAQQLRWQAQVREAKRLEAIARIAASVPYADAIAAASADPLKPTKATEAWSAEANFDRGAFTSNVGFSDAKLFSDPRFKLGHALRDAGVHRSTASAAVIKAACPVARAPY